MAVGTQDGLYEVVLGVLLNEAHAARKAELKPLQQRLGHCEWDALKKYTRPVNRTGEKKVKLLGKLYRTFVLGKAIGT